MERGLDVAFLWHMHQPLYKDPFVKEYLLPWVRLHAVKDYYDMLAILEEFPEIHQTFNIVPSLAEQLLDYANGTAKESLIELSLKKAEDLTVDDKISLLKDCFLLNRRNMIKPFPRFWELFNKRGCRFNGENMLEASRYFSDQDYRDLQVLYNMAWIDPHIRSTEELPRRLEEQGRGYCEEDKKAIIGFQHSLIGSILPKYREMSRLGLVEISTSPYYHPILPLLIDSNAGRESCHDIKLPKYRFQHPEDAREQVRRAIELHCEIFGDAPRGIWPSEGAVSDEALQIMAGEGFEWTASDDNILFSSSLSSGDTPSPYKAYSFSMAGKEINILFRDSALSNLIGFSYAGMDPEKAADDMTSRLVSIHDSLSNPSESIVTIALDGENAWEYYRNDGREFLVALYKRLSKSKVINCVTISEHLDRVKPMSRIHHIHPGSWISRNFNVWIGHDEDNVAWERIEEARRGLVGVLEDREMDGENTLQDDKITEAWENIYIAEGSDWFWWYGDEHSSENRDIFDSLFRNRLKKVYRLIGRDSPDILDFPIFSGDEECEPVQTPTGFISPRIDGRVTNYFEWLSAGRIGYSSGYRRGGGAMHNEHPTTHTGLIKEIYYGFNEKKVFLRIDYKSGGLYDDDGNRIRIVFVAPAKFVITADTVAGSTQTILSYDSITEDETISTEFQPINPDISLDSIIEIAISFSDIKASPGDYFRFYVVSEDMEKGITRWPGRGFISVEVPSVEFERINWFV